MRDVLVSLVLVLLPVHGATEASRSDILASPAAVSDEAIAATPVSALAVIYTLCGEKVALVLMVGYDDGKGDILIWDYDKSSLDVVANRVLQAALSLPNDSIELRYHPVDSRPDGVRVVCEGRT